MTPDVTRKMEKQYRQGSSGVCFDRVSSGCGAMKGDGCRRVMRTTTSPVLMVAGIGCLMALRELMQELGDKAPPTASMAVFLWTGIASLPVVAG